MMNDLLDDNDVEFYFLFIFDQKQLILIVQTTYTQFTTHTRICFYSLTLFLLTTHTFIPLHTRTKC